MPRTKQEEGAVEEFATRAQSIVASLSKEKDLGGTVLIGSGSLLSDTPYYISTQCATVDYAISRRGIPGGKLTTIFGKEGSGKSTLTDHILAECQRMGGIAAKIDSEARFDRTRSKATGLDVDDLILIQGATLEQALRAIDKLMDKAREIDPTCPVCIVYDSLAGSIPEKRLDAEVGDMLPGLTARVVNAELPRLAQKAARLGIALVFVNQIRSRIQMGGDPRTSVYRERNKVMGQQYSMLAEWPLLFQSSLMMYVNMVGYIGKDKENPDGIRSRAEIRKCSIGPGEGRRAEFDIYKLTGIDILGSKFEMLEKLGIISGGHGGWYKLDPKLFPNVKSFRREDFAQVLAAYPALEDAVRDAPVLWESEGAPQVSSSEVIEEELDGVFGSETAEAEFADI